MFDNCVIDKFLFEEREATVVHPTVPSNGYWVWKAEYFDAFPNLEEAMVGLGYHICFIDHDNRWASPESIEQSARFLQFVAEKYGLKQRGIAVGMSCGGLQAIKLAAKYPEKIACLYLDNPVLNYMSCPCGFGIGEPLYGPGTDRGIQEILAALELSGISELISYREMPMDCIPALVASQIPVAMVAGDADRVVPFEENGLLLQRAYRKAVDKLTELLVAEGALHAVRLKQKSKTKRKKKIAAAIYEYQADCDGEWGEISLDFENGTAEIIRLADWDTMKTNRFANKAIVYLLNCENEKLPKETIVAAEL